MNAPNPAVAGSEYVTDELRARDPVFFQKVYGLPEIISSWLCDRTQLETARILDFGCGHGETALGTALRLPRANVFGVDLTTSAEALRARTKELLPQLAFPANLRIEQIEAGDVPTFGAKFDVIYSWSVIEHIDAGFLDEVLRQLSDALVDDGWMFVQIEPLFYSAFGHHVSWGPGFAWAHLTDQSDKFAKRLRKFAPEDHAAAELTSCYDTLNRLTAEELKDRLESAGFFIDAQYRTKRKTDMPEGLLYAYRRDVVETEQLVMACRKKGPVTRAAQKRLSPRDLEASTAGFHRSAIDNLKGWWSDLPHYSTGLGKNLFEHSEEVRRCLELLGGVQDFSVFEVGPRDGYHTYALERAGATVLAVEQNFDNYMRCLQVKNQYGLQSKFLFGDADPVLSELDGWFDLVFLGGVVHRFKDPAARLQRILGKTDRVYVWTHVYDEVLVSSNQNPRGDGKLLGDMLRKKSQRVLDGQTYTYHQLDYEVEALGQGDFSGGVAEYSNWLESKDLYRIFELAGFEIVGLTEFNHLAGPAVQFVAKRRRVL
jgi:SAM-dependent methyltransferase